MRWNAIAAGLLAVGALHVAPVASAGEDPLTEEDRADLAWFEGLGYPSGAGKPFVELSPGGNPVIRGFLLEDSAERIRVLGLGLTEWSFEPSPPGTPEDRQVRVERLRIDDECEKWLHGGASPAGAGSRFPGLSLPSVQTRVLVLAHAIHTADERGRDAGLVHALLEHARTLQHEHWRHYRTPDDPSRPLRERVAVDLAATETFRAKMNLVGTAWWGESIATDRQDQLAAFREILERFPGAAVQDEVRGFADVLERMVREAGERVAEQRPLEELEGAERFAELVYRLREQKADLPAPMGGAPAPHGGAYAMLVEAGLDAVPALIDALGDDALTRHGGEGRSGVSPYVSRVGDLALAAIQEIAGRTFQGQVPAGTKVDAIGVAAYRTAWRLACRPAIEAWYAEARSGGEAAGLVRLVEAGDYGSLQAVKTLLAKDASLVPDAVLRGYAAAKAPYVKDEFLGLLLRHCGEKGRALVHAAARDGEAWSRFQAARLLVGAKDPVGAEALLARWQERRDGGGPGLSAPGGGSFIDRPTEFRLIVEGLLPMATPETMRTLGDDLLARSPPARRVLVRALAAFEADDDVVGAVDEILAAALDDPTEYYDEFGEQVPAEGMAFRVRDVVAGALAPRYSLTGPKKLDPFWKRDALVAAVANAWARAHDQPERPVPELPPIPGPDPERLEGVLSNLAAHAYGTPERKAEIEELKALGLGALPAVRAGLAAKRFGFARDVEQTVAAMEFIVRTVRIDARGTELPAPVREGLAALEGKPLTAGAHDALTWEILRHAGAKGTYLAASLDVYRGADGGGVVVTFTVLDGRPGGWTVSSLGSIEGRFVQGGDGSGSSWASRPPRRGTSRLQMARNVLAAQPGQRAWMHMSVVRRPY